MSLTHSRIQRPELRALKVLGAAWLENSGANTSVPAAMLPGYSAAATLGKASRGWLSCERANRSFRRKRERAATSVGDVAARVSSTVGSAQAARMPGGWGRHSPYIPLGEVAHVAAEFWRVSPYRSRRGTEGPAHVASRRSGSARLSNFRRRGGAIGFASVRCVPVVSFYFFSRPPARVPGGFYVRSSQL